MLSSTQNQSRSPILRFLVFPYWDLKICEKNFYEYLKFVETQRPKTSRSVFFIYFL